MANTTADDILYGHSKKLRRSKQDAESKKSSWQLHNIVLPNGVIEFYAATGELYKIQVPDSATDDPQPLSCSEHKNDYIATLIKPGREAIYHFQNGQYHRDDGPAVEFGNGDYQWHQHGQLHRNPADGPAMTEQNRAMAGYWVKGQLSRPPEDGPALTVDDKIEYWLNGEKHRPSEQGAAIISPECREYWVEGKPHCLHEPAIIRIDRSKNNNKSKKLYFINGKKHKLITWVFLSTTILWGRGFTKGFQSGLSKIHKC